MKPTDNQEILLAYKPESLAEGSLCPCLRYFVMATKHTSHVEKTKQVTEEREQERMISEVASGAEQWRIAKPIECIGPKPYKNDFKIQSPWDTGVTDQNQSMNTL